MKNEISLNEISLKDSVVKSSPHPFALLVSGDKNKKNAMGISWFTLVSMKPGKMVFAISQKGYSAELIDIGSFVSLCIPLISIKEQAMNCCKASGRNTDKIAEFGIELVEDNDRKAYIVKDSSVAWVLKVCEKTPVGDHNLYIADIVSCYGGESDKGLKSFEGYRRLDVL